MSKKTSTEEFWLKDQPSRIPLRQQSKLSERLKTKIGYEKNIEKISNKSIGIGKTPAQDRLKKLQKDLVKNQMKQNPVVHKRPVQNISIKSTKQRCQLKFKNKNINTQISQQINTNNKLNDTEFVSHIKTYPNNNKNQIKRENLMDNSDKSFNHTISTELKKRKQNETILHEFGVKRPRKFTEPNENLQICPSIETKQENLNSPEKKVTILQKAFTLVKEFTSNIFHRNEEKKSFNVLDVSSPVIAPETALKTTTTTIQPFYLGQSKEKTKNLPTANNAYKIFTNPEKCTDVQKRFSVNDRLKLFRQDLHKQATSTSVDEDILMDDNEINKNKTMNILPNTSTLDWTEYNRQLPMKMESQEVKPTVFCTTSPASQANTTRDKCFTSTEKYLIVVDTNVFVNNLTLIKNVLNGNFESKTVKPMLMVPFIVLQELDKLKMKQNDCSVTILATQAIRFLNSKFNEKHPSIKGQSLMDDGKHLFQIDSPDDRILNYCLQLKKIIDNTSPLAKVILLSNDINLRNKAMCSNVIAMSKGDLKYQLKIN